MGFTLSCINWKHNTPSGSSGSGRPVDPRLWTRRPSWGSSTAVRNTLWRSCLARWSCSDSVSVFGKILDDDLVLSILKLMVHAVLLMTTVYSIIREQFLPWAFLHLVANSRGRPQPQIDLPYMLSEKKMPKPPSCPCFPSSKV